MAYKKLGTYKEIFGVKNVLTNFLIMAIFDRNNFESAITSNLTDKNIKELFPKYPKLIRQNLNTILISFKRNKLVIQLGITKELSKQSSKIKNYIVTKYTFAIDLETLNVYNSEY